VVERVLDSLRARRWVRGVDQDVGARDRSELGEPSLHLGHRATGHGDPDALQQRRFENGEL
jgi:hypothetical protein